MAAGQVEAIAAKLNTAGLPLPVWLYLFGVTIPIGFQVGPLAMTSLRCLLLVVTVPLSFKLLSGKLGRIIATDFLFFLHILWAVVALGMNNPDKVVEQVGSVGIEFLGGYVIARAYIRTAEDFVALCRVLVLFVCCSAPLAMFETLTGRPILLEIISTIPGVKTVGFNYQETRFGLERVQMGFAHPIHYGLFCSVAFSFGFVALKKIRGLALRSVSSAIIGLCGFLALSSGALLAIFLQIGLIAWAIIFAKIRIRWWLLFALFVLAYVVIDLVSNRTPIRVFMSYATFSAHTAYWRSIIFDWGMRSVWVHPFFGIGLNDWVRPWYMYSGSMDNFWLVMAVRYGIPGFLFLVIGYIIVIVRVMRRNFDADLLLANFRRAWVFTMLGLSFTLCTVHVWTSIYSFVFFVFGAGIWMIHVQPEVDLPKEDKTSDDPARIGAESKERHYTRFPIGTKPPVQPRQRTIR